MTLVSYDIQITDGAAIHVVCSDQDEMVVLCNYLSSFRILYRTALRAKIIALDLGF